MKKVILIAALLGFLIAISIGLPGLYSYHKGNRTPPSNTVSAITLCLWPTSATLIDADDNAAGYVMFAFSAVGNGVIYGFVAFVSAFAWKNVFSSKSLRDKGQGWWPGNRVDQ